MEIHQLIGFPDPELTFVEDVVEISGQVKSLDLAALKCSAAVGNEGQVDTMFLKQAQSFNCAGERLNRIFPLARIRLTDFRRQVQGIYTQTLEGPGNNFTAGNA